MALVLLIVGFIMIATSLTHGADNSLRQRIAMVVRMSEAASVDDIRSMEAFLGSQPFSASVSFYSAEEIFAEEYRFNAELLQALDSNPYTPEFDVFLNHRYACSDSINNIISDLSAMKGVDSVYSSAEVADSINYILSRITLYLSVLGIVMMIISVVLIFNTVNLVVYSRRFIIHTMKLVGARPAFIRRPFLMSGIRLGMIAGVVASAVLCAIHFYVVSSGIEYLFLPDWIHTAVLCIVLVVLGAVFCGTAAYLASSRFIRYSYDSLYTK